MPKDVKLILCIAGASLLERLPLSLARCPLTALWLSQNQSQPVVTLQRDVDEVTNEEFLTCYLLPQDQLESQAELDPTMSPSELASLTGGPTTVGPMNLNDPDAIAVETNYAYEPAMPDTQPQPHPAISNWPAITEAKCARPESVTSSTPSSMILSPPVSPNGMHSSTGDRVGSPAGQQRSSFSPRSSLTNPAGEWDSGSSRVHFNTTAKQDESKEKSSIKGFPKTRHPRFAKKPTDYQPNSRDDSSYSQSNDPNSLDESRSSVTHSPTDPRLSVRSPTEPHKFEEHTKNGMTHIAPGMGTVASARLATFDSRRPSDGLHESSPPAQNRVSRRNSPAPTSEEDDARLAGCTGPSPHAPSGSPNDANNPVRSPQSVTPSAKPRKKAFHLYTTPSLVVPTASPTAMDRNTVSSKSPSPRLVSSHDPSYSEPKVASQKISDGEESQNRLDVNPNMDEDAYSSGGVSFPVLRYVSG
ncbi:unnamed protein product [Echinostoma caproni]|uniref:Uncharacterized protein n=1 Tax=Echinostoma caproni TaxID=27848 RepID=A0A3P8GKG4_9TREM|nr:unnamed protein product [Echinostoma caproni]